MVIESIVAGDELPDGRRKQGLFRNPPLVPRRLLAPSQLPDESSDEMRRLCLNSAFFCGAVPSGKF